MRRPRLRRDRTDDTTDEGRRTGRWSDRLVVACLALGVAGFAFAGGRLTVQRGPDSVQEAMQMAQAGELPFAPGGGATTAGGGPGGAAGGGGFPGGGVPPAGGAPADGAPTG